MHIDQFLRSSTENVRKITVICMERRGNLLLIALRVSNSNEDGELLPIYGNIQQKKKFSQVDLTWLHIVIFITDNKLRQISLKDVWQTGRNSCHYLFIFNIFMLLFHPNRIPKAANIKHLKHFSIDNSIKAYKQI